MRCFKLIEQIAQLQKKIADLELSLNSQRSINSRLIKENNRLIQEIASIGNPIYNLVWQESCRTFRSADELPHLLLDFNISYKEKLSF